MRYTPVVRLPYLLGTFGLVLSGNPAVMAKPPLLFGLDRGFLMDVWSEGPD